MPGPQIELWLYDTQADLNRDAAQGRVCPWDAIPVVRLSCPAREAPALPWRATDDSDNDLTGLQRVLAFNGRAGLPTQMHYSLDAFLDGTDPLLLAATWDDLWVLMEAVWDHHDPAPAWMDRPLTLHYRGFTGPMPPRALPRFAALFPAQTFPLVELLDQALASRRRPLPRRSHPFPISDYGRGVWRTANRCRRRESSALPSETTACLPPDNRWLNALRGWKIRSCLPDRGVPMGMPWNWPLDVNYPRLWVLDRLPAGEWHAYTFHQALYPAWVELLCQAIRHLPAGARRLVFVPESWTPMKDAECIATGHCFCFAVEEETHRITITRDEDARAAFRQGVANYRTGGLGLPTKDPDALLTAAWHDLWVQFGPAGVPLTLYRNGTPVPAAACPLLPFPARPGLVLHELEAALAHRRRPLPGPARPFPMEVFYRESWQDAFAQWRWQTPAPLREDADPPEVWDEWLESLRGWKVRSALPDRGIAGKESSCSAPLAYRYPTLWIIDRLPTGEQYACTVPVGCKHPGWPLLLSSVLRNRPAGASRRVFVPERENSSRAPVRAVRGPCLCFAVDEEEHRITITRNDDARVVFHQALADYLRSLDADARHFPR